MDLIEQLKAKQRDMSQAEFAALLGISEAMLSRIYSGERLIGEDVGRRISRIYPDLQLAVIVYLMSKKDAPETADTDGERKAS